MRNANLSNDLKTVDGVLFDYQCKVLYLFQFTVRDFHPENCGDLIKTVELVGLTNAVETGEFEVRLIQ
jgi:hypothetical protein